MGDSLSVSQPEADEDHPVVHYEVSGGSLEGGDVQGVEVHYILRGASEVTKLLLRPMEQGEVAPRADTPFLYYLNACLLVPGYGTLLVECVLAAKLVGSRGISGKLRFFVPS